MARFRPAWRGWTRAQLFLFLVETAVLATVFLWLSHGDHLPLLVRILAGLVGWVVLLVGVGVLLGWVTARATRRRGR